jgi:DNA-binding NarL/FixJ family response regulator
MRPLTVLVVSNTPLFRAGVAHALGADQNLRLLEGLEALEGSPRATDRDAIDVILVEADGTSDDLSVQIAHLQRLAPKAGILVLSNGDDLQHTVAAFGAGARGFARIPTLLPDQLRAGVRAVGAGSWWMCPETTALLVSRLLALRPHLDDLLRTGGAHGLLSKREQQVLELVAQGASNKEIAAALYLSENTVKTYLRRIFEKLQVDGRREAVEKVFHTPRPPSSPAREPVDRLARTAS